MGSRFTQKLDCSHINTAKLCNTQKKTPFLPQEGQARSIPHLFNLLSPSKQHRTYINLDQKFEGLESNSDERDNIKQQTQKVIPQNIDRGNFQTIQKRIKLLDLVLRQGFTLTKAAKVLHIKRPTAKMIFRRFQKAGTYFEKKMPNKESQDQGEKPEIREKQVSVEEAANPSFSINIGSNDQTISFLQHSATFLRTDSLCFILSAFRCLLYFSVIFQ